MGDFLKVLSTILCIALLVIWAIAPAVERNNLRKEDEKLKRIRSMTDEQIQEALRRSNNGK